MREQQGDDSKHMLVSLDFDYLLFGHGRHVWYNNVVLHMRSRWLTGYASTSPGRFLAGSELKTMLAHILLNYDVKMANDGGRPENVWYGRNCSPDPTAQVLFQRRSRL